MVTNFVQGMRFKSAAVALLASLALSACGGGGGSPGVTPRVDPTLDLTIAYGASTPVNTATTTTPATIRATVRDSAGHGRGNVVVYFTSLPNDAVSYVGNSAGSVVTDGSGVASINVLASGTFTGGVKMTATAMVDTKSATNTIGLNAAP